MFTALLSPADFHPHLTDPAWVIVECRLDLAAPDWGEAQYHAVHVPTAVYAHLDRDLLGIKTGRNGRHPLLDLDQRQQRLGAWGIGESAPVVAYNQDNGLHAARLWWLLRFFSGAQLYPGSWSEWCSDPARPVAAGDA
jgi:thiosulfate/3-mercaptopyruvate sulfurtransferase